MMHERTTRGGAKYLVVVQIGSSAWGGQRKRLVSVERIAVAPPKWRASARLLGTSPGVGNCSFLMDPGAEIRAYAGQPDADDASRFTMRMEIDGNPVILDGVVHDPGAGPYAAEPWAYGLPTVAISRRQ